MDYPHDLPKENYATHIGIFLEWYLRNSFASDELKEDSKQEIDRVITGSMTGAEFLLEYFNGKLCDDNLSKTGQDFAADYYSAKAEFANKVGSYLGDNDVIRQKEKRQGVTYPKDYLFEYSPENYLLGGTADRQTV